MNIELEKWDDAFILSKNNQFLQEYVHLKYAEHLVLEDKFNEAQESYRKANRVDLSLKLLNKLINNAIIEKRFINLSIIPLTFIAEKIPKNIPKRVEIIITIIPKFIDKKKPPSPCSGNKKLFTLTPIFFVDIPKSKWKKICFK